MDKELRPQDTVNQALNQLATGEEVYVGTASIDLIVKNIMAYIDEVSAVADAAKATADKALPKTGGVINGNLGVAGSIVATGNVTGFNPTATVNELTKVINIMSNDQEVSIRTRIDTLETIANTILVNINNLKREEIDMRGE